MTKKSKLKNGKGAKRNPSPNILAEAETLHNQLRGTTGRREARKMRARLDVLRREFHLPSNLSG